MGNFAERVDQLIEQVGDGALTGSVVVDQVYAKAQHERMDYKHPQGGQAKYLSGPLLMKHRGYIQDLTDRVLTDGGLTRAMIGNMEDLSQEVFDKAPREFWDLRESGHPSVTDGSVVVYNRLPVVHRLSPGELKVKNRLRSRGLGGGAT